MLQGGYWEDWDVVYDDAAVIYFFYIDGIAVSEEEYYNILNAITSERMHLIGADINMPRSDAVPDITMTFDEAVAYLMSWFDTSGFTHEDFLALYMPIIEQYREEFNDTMPAPYMMVGYSIIDINNSGTPELIIFGQDYFILTIYSLVDFTPHRLHIGGVRFSVEINQDGLLFFRWSNGFRDNGAYIAELSFDDSRFEFIVSQWIEPYGADGIRYFWSMYDGEPIEKADWYDREFQSVWTSFDTTPMVFSMIPLFEE